MKAIERLYKYLENKGIKPTVFERNAGISNGYLSKQFSRKADIGESILVLITENCSEINSEWLLTGQGSMLRTTTPVESPQTTPQPQNDDVIALLKEQLKEKEVEIKKLNQEIGELRSDKRKLQEQVMSLDQHILKLSASLSRFQLTAGDAPSAPAHSSTHDIIE